MIKLPLCVLLLLVLAPFVSAQQTGTLPAPPLALQQTPKPEDVAWHRFTGRRLCAADYRHRRPSRSKASHGDAMDGLLDPELNSALANIVGTNQI
jgi:hypothetical protein